MTISINKEILQKYNLSIEEFLVLYLCAKEVNIENLITSLIEKGLCDKNLYNPLSAVISNNTKEFISSVLIDSDKAVIDKDEEFLNLAEKMRNIYPSGRKEGTTYMWRDSNAVIAKKLKTLVVKFDFHFTEEQALNATRRYVESFNGNYSYMQLLKYFILKNDRRTDELRSEFMSLIENENDEDAIFNFGELV